VGKLVKKDSKSTENKCVVLILILVFFNVPKFCIKLFALSILLLYYFLYKTVTKTVIILKFV